MQLWEILVPTCFNCGTTISTDYHKAWDERVYKISGGLTIFQPVRGKWIAPSGELLAESMIPVRIATSKKNIEEIIDFSLKYYDQLAIMAYKISDDVIIKHKGK